MTQPERFKPSRWFILLRRPRSWGSMLVLAALLGVLGPFASGVVPAAVVWWAVAIAIASAAVLLVWDALEYAARWYELRDSGVVSSGGVLRKWRREVPRHAVQAVAVDRRLRERVFGLGSVGFASAGTGGYEVWWFFVNQPHDRCLRARALVGPQATDRPRTDSKADAQTHDTKPNTERHNTPEPAGAKATPAARTPPVIGLVGGIGAGKSEVARAFADLGCAVSDSDAAVREILQRPEIITQVHGWWGDRVLAGEPGVPAKHTPGSPSPVARGLDRRAIADIVFNDPDERTRLEGLLHPLVHQERERLAARSVGKPAVVVDAPLLLEAGIADECDLVAFVDAPRAVRAARVASRGWQKEELARREAAQWPLERKRAAAGEVIVNDDQTTREELREHARRVLGILERRP